MSRAPRSRAVASLAAALALSVLSHAIGAADLAVAVRTPAGAAVANAVVYLTPLGASPAASGSKAIIDQVNRQFVPRASVLQVGTSVSFPNSDNIRHSVYSFSAPKIFTLKLYAGTPSSPVVFDKPGVVVLGCNIHDGMVAWVLVVDGPYYARTDAAGTVTLANVPPGEYRLRAWREPLSAEQDGEVIRVDASGNAQRTVRLDVGALEMPEMRH